MKKYLKVNLVISLLIVSGISYAQKYNPLVQDVFWKQNPTIKTVTRYVTKGNSVVATNDKGLSVLQIAISSMSNFDIIKLLVEKGANVNQKDTKGNTALTYAVRFSSPKILNYLIEKGGDIHVVNNKGNDLGAMLVISYHQDTIQAFVDKMNLLINHGYNPTQAKVQNGNCLLQVAVRSKNTKVLEQVLQMNIPVNFVNKEGYAPLHVAVMTGEDDLMIRQLIKAGASKTITTAFGETAYDLAKENENFKHKNININQLK